MLHHRVSLEPCLPRPAKEPPAGAGWIHEIKHDGFRILARRDKDRVRLATRNGSDFTARYPKIVTAVERLPVRSCVLDGEAIVVNERGLSVFEPLRHRTHDHTAVLCAFDLLESRRRPAGGDLGACGDPISTARRAAAISPSVM